MSNLSYSERFDHMRDWEQMAVVYTTVGHEDMFKKILEGIPDDTRETTVTVQINGVEVDAKQFLDRLEEAFTKSVNDAAKELASEKFDGIEEEINEYVETLHEGYMAIREKYGLVKDSWDNWDDD